MDPIEPPQSISRSHRAAWLTVRALGVLAGCVGVYLAYGSVTELLRHLRDALATGGFPWGVFIYLFLACAAIWCLHSSYRAWWPKGDPPIRSLSGILALIVFDIMLLSLDGQAISLPAISASTMGTLVTCSMTLLSFALYIALTWWLFAALEIAHFERRIPEFVIVVTGLEIWVASSNLMIDVLPIARGRAEWLGLTWPLAALVVPIAVAVLIGRLLRKVGNRPQVSSHELFTK
jgi:hypothetical protein